MANALQVPRGQLDELHLPPVCCITGATRGVVYKAVKFGWLTPSLEILLVVSEVLTGELTGLPRRAVYFLTATAVTAAIIGRRVAGKLPFTEEAYATWRRSNAIYLASMVYGLVALSVGIGLVAPDSRIFVRSAAVVAFGAGLLASAIAVPVTTYFRFLKSKNVSVTHSVKDHAVIELHLPNAELRERYRQHLDAGTLAGPSISQVPTAG